jgi:hypothetical protein
MNLQTKAHGHTSHCAHLTHMVVMDLGIEFFAVFRVAQLHLLQLEAITCMRMSKRLCC